MNCKICKKQNINNRNFQSEILYNCLDHSDISKNYHYYECSYDSNNNTIIQETFNYTIEGKNFYVVINNNLKKLKIIINGTLFNSNYYDKYIFSNNMLIEDLDVIFVKFNKYMNIS